MPALFLSHSSADKIFVRRIATALEEYDINCWLDEGEMNIGDSLITKISDAIKDSEYVAAIISKNSQSSQWVLKELQWAMTKEINGKRVIVLPIVIDDCVIPFFLRDKLYADLSADRNFDDGIKSIANTVLQNRFIRQQNISYEDNTKSTVRKTKNQHDIGKPSLSFKDTTTFYAINNQKKQALTFYLIGLFGVIVVFSPMFFHKFFGYSILTTSCVSFLVGSLLTASTELHIKAFEKNRILLQKVDQLDDWLFPFSPLWKKHWKLTKNEPVYKYAVVCNTLAVILLLGLFIILPIILILNFKQIIG